MPFEVSVTGSTHNEVVVLKELFTNTQADIFTFGALLNSFSIQQNGEANNVVVGFKDVADARENLTNGFQSAKLSPYVCRMKEGKYTFANEHYHVEKFYLGRDAIHGLIYNGDYTIKEKGATDTSAYVTLAYEYEMADKGYPFVYSSEVTYTLQANNNLSISTKITNLGTKTMPLSDGWHPYFKLGESVNDLSVQFRSTHLVEFDERLLPTGNFHPYHTFNQPEILKETVLDNCFVLDENYSEPACTLIDETSKLQLDILPEKSYPYLQIYTPDNRKSIAIENLSSVPDAFNNAIGLVMLESFASVSFTTTYRLTNLGN